MPIVLVTDAPTASGHRYDDVLGKQYEFPDRYRKSVRSGDRFLYYRGSRGVTSGRPEYFGGGVLGLVRSSSRPAHLVVELHDVQLFAQPVIAKQSDGVYLETGAAKGTNWANGVRRISNEAFERILTLAKCNPLERGAPGRAFASPEHASRLERYSVEVAVSALEAEFGHGCVEEMPPGNPGFDLRVDRPGGDLYVEVKGTILADPVFHLSEGQRRHAEACGANYRLFIVFDVNVERRVHRVVSLDGPLDTKIELHPEAWIGRVLTRHV